MRKAGNGISVDGVVEGGSGSGGETNTTYYKLTGLCADLETSIKSVSTMTRDDTMGEIMRIRAEAFALPSPEAEYASRLFKLYSDMATKNAFDNVSFTAELPPALFEGHADQISGQEALRKNIFWFRIMVGVFGALCFLPLSTLTILAYPEIAPVDLMTDDCEVDIPGIYGYDTMFTLRPYAYVLAVGVMVFVHSVVVALYYLLPVDNQGRKYIPGLEDSRLLLCCVPKESIAYGSQKVGGFFSENTKILELVADSFLFVLMLIACILASWALDAQVAFSGDDSSYTVYETFSTFTSTFSNTDPECITMNPVPIIRGSLAMAYLALLAFGFALQVSLRSYLKHRQNRSGYLFTIDDSQHSSISSGSSASVPSRSSSSSSPAGGRGTKGTRNGNDDDVVTITL